MGMDTLNHRLYHIIYCTVYCLPIIVLLVFTFLPVNQSCTSKLLLLLPPPSPSSLVTGAVEIASTIASKSPVAVQTSKLALIHARDHSVQEGLDFIVSTVSG